jgi:hypothetical protein
MPKNTQARIDNGTRSKAKWRRRNPAKARRRNAIDCLAYYHRNAERINARRRELRECADLLPALPKPVPPPCGYVGKLTLTERTR